MKTKIKQVYEFLVSMKTVVFFLSVLAIGAAVATFIENDFGTDAARALVYNHWWYELLILLLAVGLIGNIIRFKMWQKGKMSIFVFHASFLLIFFGAFVTRYFGHEGSLNIREGDSNNAVLTQETHIKASSSGLNAAYQVRLTPVTSNNFNFKANLGGGAPLTIKYKEFYTNASEAIVKDEISGVPFVSLQVANSGSRASLVELFENEYVDLGVMILGFGNDMEFDKPAVIVSFDNNQLTVKSQSDLIRRQDMKDFEMLRAHTVHPFDSDTLYSTLEGVDFVLDSYITKARKKVVSTSKKTGISAVVVDASFKDETKEVILMGGAGMTGQPRTVELSGKEFVLSFGSDVIELPFTLRLDKFLIDRYPGSMSPSSYESHVTVLDKAKGVEMPYRIYMNNILSYGGYRFYQSSYDQDEKGTILSVAKDPGMWPTYFGYLLLVVGFVMAFFSPKSRFRRLADMIEKNRSKYLTSIITLFALFALNSTPLNADQNSSNLNLERVGSGVLGIVDSDHADRFAELFIQDSAGRIKPVDTLAREILQKLSGSDKLKTLEASQVFVGMITVPKSWQQVKMIKLGHPEIADILGIEPKAKVASLVDFFDLNASHGQNPYKLADLVLEATRTPQADQTKLQKELIKADERANIAYMVYQGQLLKIIPVQNDPSYSWISPVEMLDRLTQTESKEVAKLLYGYFNNIKEAQVSNDYSEANKMLDEIRNYQLAHGVAVIPSSTKAKAEIVLNKLNIFDRLTPYYFTAGLLFLAFAFVQVFSPSNSSARKVINGGFIAVILALFAAHTAALILRWYVSGHAPWSNGYESMVYIAWATILAGLLFNKNSVFALPSATIFSGFALMVAHLSWMDPQITTLVPVLKSYWLTIHVSVISASYGFLGLSALLGFISLILFFLRSQNRLKIDRSIKEMTHINEMSMMIGLALLSFGNLFGAIWANESWGRYWSWDPKETWTFVSMIVYAVVLHLRFVPALRSTYAFALASLLAFWSILMTYFGVNYFLSGLHSYAGGDPMPIPSWLPIAVAVIATVALLAWLKRDSKKPLEG